MIKDNTFELRKKTGISNSKKIVMYCGSLIPGKGIGKILETAKLFGPDVYFYIVGGKRNHLEYWKKKTHIEKIKNVVFTGFVENRYVPVLLKCADILFMPYDLDEESHFDIHTTSPIKIFEYMASKKPIISLNLPTISKIICHEKEGFLTTNDNPQEYYSAIKKLIEDPALADELAKNAYQKVLNFTYQKRCRSIISYFINSF